MRTRISCVLRFDEKGLQPKIDLPKSSIPIGCCVRADPRPQVAPQHCLALEDSLNGVLASKAARMACLVRHSLSPARPPAVQPATATATAPASREPVQTRVRQPMPSPIPRATENSRFWQYGISFSVRPSPAWQCEPHSARIAAQW